MADYTQITDFSAKDSLSTGDPNKLIVGADFDAEFDAIATAIATKLGPNGPEIYDGGNVLRAVGYNVLPVQTEDADDTLAAIHAGGVFMQTDQDVERTLTLEASTSANFPVGSLCTIVNADDARNVVVANAVDTTLYVLTGTAVTDAGASAIAGPGSVASLWRKSTTVYYLFGNGVAA